jgi:hypothetical protein
VIRAPVSGGWALIFSHDGLIGPTQCVLHFIQFKIRAYLLVQTAVAL